MIALTCRSLGKKTRMPESLLTFLSVLYIILKHKRTSAKDLAEFVNPLIDESNQNNEKEGGEYEEEKEQNWIKDHKSSQLYCLFQKNIMASIMVENSNLCIL